MTITPELKQAVAQAGEEPVRVEDPENHIAYVVIKEEAYRRLKEAVEVETVDPSFFEYGGSSRSRNEDPRSRAALSRQAKLPQLRPAHRPGAAGGTGRTRPVFFHKNEHWSSTTGAARRCDHRLARNPKFAYHSDAEIMKRHRISIRRAGPLSMVVSSLGRMPYASRGWQEAASDCHSARSRGRGQCAAPLEILAQQAQAERQARAGACFRRRINLLKRTVILPTLDSPWAEDKSAI